MRRWREPGRAGGGEPSPTETVSCDLSWCWLHQIALPVTDSRKRSKIWFGLGNEMEWVISSIQSWLDLFSE